MIKIILILTLLFGTVHASNAAVEPSGHSEELSSATVLNLEHRGPKAVVEKTALNLLGEIKANPNRYDGNNGLLESLIMATLMPVMDINSIARMLAANYWVSATQEQKNQLHHSIKNVIVNSYANIFAYYDGQEVIFSQAKYNKTGGKAIVRSEVAVADFLSLSIDYKLRKINDEWFIYDASFQGNGLLNDIRSKYLVGDGIKGVDGLLASMAADSQRVDIVLANNAKQVELGVVNEPLQIVANEGGSFKGKEIQGGVAAAIVTAALQRAGYETKVKLMPWKKALSGVKDGVYDVLVSIGEHEHDRSDLILSKPYRQSRIKLIARWDNNLLHHKVESFKQLSLEKLADLSDERRYLNAALINRISSLSLMDGLKRLAANQLDFIAVDEEEARYVMKGSDVESSLEFLPGTVAFEDIHLAVSKQNRHHQAIVIAFNKALDDMQADGSYQEIVDQYALDSRKSDRLENSHADITPLY